MDYDNLPGRSRENARKALDLAVKRGFEPETVLTTRDGYMIPVADSDKENTTKSARTRTKKKE